MHTETPQHVAYLVNYPLSFLKPRIVIPWEILLSSNASVTVKDKDDDIGDYNDNNHFIAEKGNAAL